jgi:hypothetical protein
VCARCVCAACACEESDESKFVCGFVCVYVCVVVTKVCCVQEVLLIIPLALMGKVLLVVLHQAQPKSQVHLC